VQEALVQVWNKANRICAKRLIPFLPTFVEAMELHGQLHLSEECREQLLSMSAATADRLLYLARRRGPHGLSITRAGTLLKQLIPVRTFRQWEETQPGFLEVDVVAHCGTEMEGSFLCTLTLTDIATGWTECLPLLYKSQETVLEALQEARERFPFPILGLDIDNGGELLNELLLSYCEQEHLTFTRGRPYCKNDQAHVEQKNGDIVRQVVGHDRFVGVPASEQLGELYRALRLYVNCFQPSMKQQEKRSDGRKVRLVYDAAKTPLQRLLLSKVLSAQEEQALQQGFRALDPVRLFEQVQVLQEAFFVHAKEVSSGWEETAEGPVRRFDLEGCVAGSPLSCALFVQRRTEPYQQADESPAPGFLLDWPRTRNDPFKEVWELIASWILAHPERGSGEILRELQRLFPGRYEPSHLRTLQRGVRKIRARLRATVQVQWQEDVVPADRSDLVTEGVSELETNLMAAGVQAPTMLQACQEQAWKPSVLPHLRAEEETTAPSETVPEPACPARFTSSVDPDQHDPEARLWQPQAGRREEATRRQEAATGAGAQRTPASNLELQQVSQTSGVSASRPGLRQRRSDLPMEQAIQEYVEDLRRRKRQPKTLQWHQTALALFQLYLQQEYQCVFVDQITSTQVQSWFTFVQETPTTRDARRSVGTVESYARSARAFCQWLVQRRLLKRTPFAGLQMPNVEPSLPHLLEPQEWERLLQACRSPREQLPGAEQATARNQALLWVLAETGMRASEVCGLRLGDVDREQELLRVRGKGSRGRWVPLKQEGLLHLFLYMDQYRFETVKRELRKRVAEEPLFVAETGRPLTENGIALLFGRLRKRAGITRKEVNPTLLRDSFAVRYLRAGGDLFTLRELLGQEESAVVKRSLWMREKSFE
jgi:site-specific recombinase XerD